MKTGVFQRISLTVAVLFLFVFWQGNTFHSQAKVEQVQKETIVEKTETKTVYDLGTGKCRAEIYGSPVRYRDEKGTLRDYDTSLKAASQKGYAFQTKATDKMVYLPEKLTGETPVVTENDAYRAAIYMPGVGSGKSQAKQENWERITDLYSTEERKITSLDYDGIIEDAVLQYEATSNGVKENIILEKKTGVSQFDFEIQLENCYISKSESGGKQEDSVKKSINTEPEENLYLCDTGNGTRVGEIPFAFIMDAEGMYCDDCTYSVKLTDQSFDGTKVINKYQLSLSVDPKFLESEKRVYPLTIDPSISWGTGGDRSKISSAYVCKTAPDTTYNKNKTHVLCVGNRENTKDLCRSYINFEGLSATLSDSYVENVKLSLSMDKFTSGTTVYVRRPMTSWSSSSITFNSQPHRAKHELGKFTTGASKQISLSLDADAFYEVVRNKGELYGIELTDSVGDYNSSSSNRVWIFNEYSGNDASRIPRLSVEYYKLNSIDMTSSPQIRYRTYRSSGGWTGYSADGVTSGTLSASNKIRGFSLDLKDNGYTFDSVKYCAYFEGSGWTDWKYENEMVGSTTQTSNMKAIQIQLCQTNGAIGISHYDIYYRVYTDGSGWLGWARNGQEAGNYRSGQTILGIQVALTPKIQYSQSYLTSEGKDKGTVSENYSYVILEHSPTFLTHAGDQNQIYGLGISFTDPVMRRNHTISTVAYLKDGGNRFQYSGTDSTPVICGGTKTNPIVGYRMTFSDICMRAKYNIEHVASVRTSSIPEEGWKRNDTVSGAESGREPLEMVSVRIVPKDYHEGERACAVDRFFMGQDSFSFTNDGQNFKYPSDKYMIPLEKYQELFGVTEGEAIYNNELNKGWRGSCFGMVLTSYLIGNHMWDIKKFTGNIDSGTETVFGLYAQYARKSTALTDGIEYAQLSYKFPKTTVFKDCASVVDRLENYPGPRYVLSMWSGTEGHSVIPLSATRINDEEYAIDVYDPNSSRYPREVTMNIKKNTFEYGDLNRRLELLDINKFYSDHREDFDKIQNKISNSSYKLDLSGSGTAKNLVMVNNADDYEILNSQGVDVREEKETEESVSIDNINCVSYYLPEDEYTIKLKKVSKEAMVTVLNKEINMAYTVRDEGEIIVCFEKEKGLNTSIKFADNRKHNVHLKTYDKGKNRKEEDFYVQQMKAHGNSNKVSMNEVK